MLLSNDQSMKLLSDVDLPKKKIEQEFENVFED
jgi:hypothetical protein